MPPICPGTRAFKDKGAAWERTSLAGRKRMTTVIVANELALLETEIILGSDDGQSRERALTDGRLPMHSIDIFRDLGMSEGMIATYFGRWPWAA